MADLTFAVRIDRAPLDAAIAEMRRITRELNEIDGELDAPEMRAVQTYGLYMAERAIAAAIAETTHVLEPRPIAYGGIA